MADEIYQINLQELAEDYAWGTFKRDQGFLKRLFLHKKSNYIFDIPWGHVEFTHSTELRETKMSEEKQCVLYSCQYENKTNGDQTYRVSASRETTTTSRIQLGKTYTIGADMNIEVDLGFAKLGGGLNCSMSVTKESGEEFSETLIWNIDTEIKVPKQNVAKAELVVKERPIIHDFTVTTTMNLLKKDDGTRGSLPICIRRKKDKSEVATYFVKRLDVLFANQYSRIDYSKSDMVKINKKEETIDTGEKKLIYEVVLTSHGVSHSKSWAQQRVEVTCDSIEDMDNSANRVVPISKINRNPSLH